MSLEKVKILASNAGPSCWLPVVEFCLERECILNGTKKEKPFYQGRDGGSQCHIVGPVSLNDILKNFDLPEHVEVGNPYANCIFDSKNLTEISFRSFEEHEAAQKRSAELKAEYETLRLEIRRKRQEKPISMN